MCSIQIPLRTLASGTKWSHYCWTSFHISPPEANDPDLLWWNLRKPTWGRPRHAQFWRGFGTNEIHQRYLFLFPQNTYNEREGVVDSNLHPDYILLSLKFCFINCSAGGCVAEYWILNHRQPDNKYWRKGNFKISLMNRCPLRIWAKIDPWGFCRKTLTSDLPQGTFHKPTVLSEMTAPLWWFADILHYGYKPHDE